MVDNTIVSTLDMVRESDVSEIFPKEPPNGIDNEPGLAIAQQLANSNITDEVKFKITNK